MLNYYLFLFNGLAAICAFAIHTCDSRLKRRFREQSRQMLAANGKDSKYYEFVIEYKEDKEINTVLIHDLVFLIILVNVRPIPLFLWVGSCCATVGAGVCYFMLHVN